MDFKPYHGFENFAEVHKHFEENILNHQEKQYEYFFNKVKTMENLRQDVNHLQSALDKHYEWFIDTDYNRVVVDKAAERISKKAMQMEKIQISYNETKQQQQQNPDDFDKEKARHLLSKIWAMHNDMRWCIVDMKNCIFKMHDMVDLPHQDNKIIELHNVTQWENFVHTFDQQTQSHELLETLRLAMETMQNLKRDVNLMSAQLDKQCNNLHEESVRFDKIVRQRLFKSKLRDEYLITKMWQTNISRELMEGEEYLHPEYLHPTTARNFFDLLFKATTNLRVDLQDLQQRKHTMNKLVANRNFFLSPISL